MAIRSSRSRCSITSVLASATLALGASTASAQTPADQAKQLNEEGKRFLQAKPMDAARAADKFRQAIALSPEGGYYLNLCMALFHEGKLGEAYVECKAVAPHGGNAAAVRQADTIIDKHILPEMKKAGVDPEAPPAPGETSGTPTTGTQPPNGAVSEERPPGTPTAGTPPSSRNFTVPPPPSLFTQTAPPAHQYTWTLGGRIAGLSTQMGEKDAYAESGAGFQITGDYNLVPERNLGAQAYLGITNVAKGTRADTLNVFDLGIAGFKQFCAGRACLKPLAGIHLGMFQTGAMESSGGDTLTSLGLRLELGGEYALGARYENVITVGLGANFYSEAVGKDEEEAALLGLDQTSRSIYFAVGYTRRFNTPLGSSPFFRLQ